MMWTGILIGVISFLIIGGFHPIVIQCEYYFSAKIWPVFLLGGAALCAASLFLPHPILSAAAGVAGFAMLWSIKELKEQEKRVEKGWFPANPKRRTKTRALRQEKGFSKDETV